MNLEKARQILIDHARSPRNRIQGGAPATAALGEAKNPLCGDLVRVYLTIENSRILHCALEVQGCTMCAASASLMSENIKSLATVEAERLRQAFQEILLGGAEQEWPDTLKAFAAFTHLRVNQGRIPCALIPWYALKEALQRWQSALSDTRQCKA